jgi:hypothetical protein
MLEERVPFNVINAQETQTYDEIGEWNHHTGSYSVTLPLLLIRTSTASQRHVQSLSDVRGCPFDQKIWHKLEKSI